MANLGTIPGTSGAAPPPNPRKSLVGGEGFEPPTPSV